MSALAVAAIAYVGVAQAQENATITLRSGERISGQLLDHGGVGFTIKVNNEDRRIPTNDVAIIDFTGGTMSEADWAKVTGGQNVVWLRNGQTLTGQFYDIGGTTPLIIKFKTDAGERELPSSEIARIVLARTESAAAAGAATLPAATSGSGIVVSARQQWTPTGLIVRRGEQVTFNSTGEILLGGGPDDVAAPAGARSGRMDVAVPLPRSIVGALIGRIGNGQPFGIGNQTRVPMPASGQLFLGINDNNLDDNSGEFRVEITRGTGRR
ncbi:MAG TPA: LecA/PA-IL family lectin [Vicinamibacterales bacterium]|nr:LecA/PA-IL family lectin [Vicinamibacterales bacterium]